MSFTTLTMPPPVTAGVLPSVPGLLITVRPSQLHTVTHQPALATWQGVQGPLGDSGQPVGLGPWDVGQGQPLYPRGCTALNVPAHAGPLPPQHPAAQHRVQVSPVLRTHPGSAQKLLEAFNKDVVASEDGVPAATPCQPALDMLSGRSRTKHQEVVTTPPSPENLLDLPELGPDAFNEAFPELAEDNLQFQDEHSSAMDSSDPLAWLDSILELPEVLSGSCLTTLLNKFPEFSEIPDLLECMMEGNCPKDQVVAAMQEDTNPSWQRVATSPLLDAKGKQGGLAAVFPTRLPESPMEPSQEGPMDTSEESPLKGCPEGPHKGLPESPQQILLKSPLASPPTAPQHHPPRVAQLVEEVLQRQPRVILTRLPPPPGISSCRVVPRSGKAAGKQAKRPTSADTLGMPEMSPWGSMPPKKRKKMVVCPVAKSSKTLWEGKPHRDATAVGCSGEQGGSSKQRPSNSDYVPTKRARTLRNTRRQGSPHCPSRR
ncbi:uncharacterized protein LOC121082053 [Falco naumanni]|uniref:uncharacterized protein LOC121082053 n=1 Tax=Falco naumanni TaxID=148594 RepID=UPI001ADDFDDF|nr:uncharacterized protein LOC121082053 [Falco naumanni]